MWQWCQIQKVLWGRIMTCKASGSGSDPIERNNQLTVSLEDSSGVAGPDALRTLEETVAIRNLMWWYRHELEEICKR